MVRSGKTKVAGVIGWPVTHSLSPRLHGYWLQHYGIDAAYIPLAVKPEELGDVMRALPKMGISGVNLTLPHKELVLGMLDEVSAEAQAIGAVNTVTIADDGALYGTNTDAYGFAENIRPSLGGKNKAVIFGAGGAARAVCHALIKEGFKELVVTNRTPERAESLAVHFAGSMQVGSWEKRSQLLEQADLLVNTTSLGLRGHAALDVDFSLLPRQALVTDIVYTPLMTPLLEKARARGNPFIDGLGMLMHQAVPGFHAWFGTKPDVSEGLRRYLLEGL